MEITKEVLAAQAVSLESKVMALKVSCNDELKLAGDLLFNIKEFIKNCDAKKKELVKPFKDGIRKLESEFDPKIDKAKELKQILESSMVNFQMEERRKHEEEEKQRRMEEMLRLEKIKEDLEAKAADKNSSTLLNEAIKVEERQEKIMQEPIKIKDSVKGEFATTGLSMKWTYEVENEIDIPREYCSSDSGKLRQAVNNGIREIKGVKIYQKPSITSRL